MPKLACIVYIEGEADPSTAKARLESSGFEVSLIGLTAEQFRIICAGEINVVPEELLSLLQSADLVVFLLSDTVCDVGNFEALAGPAAGGGADIVGVWPQGESHTGIPQTMQDFASDLVGEASEVLEKVLCGDDEAWEMPSGEKAPSTKASNQKKC